MILLCIKYASSALTLLVGRQEGHTLDALLVVQLTASKHRPDAVQPVKKLSGGVLVWLSVWRKVQTCIWSSWWNCHSQSLASAKYRLVLPFWYRLTWVVPEKGPLNGCVCVERVCAVYKVCNTKPFQYCYVTSTIVTTADHFCNSHSFPAICRKQ